MEFRLLGSVEVVDDGSRVDLGARQQRALLGLLLLHANRVVTTDRILEALWGDDAFGKENALWVVISRLRSALEPDRAKGGENAILVTRDWLVPPGTKNQARHRSVDRNGRTYRAI